MRIEAVIFAASQPVSRETLCALIGSDCHLDLLIDDIRDEHSVWRIGRAADRSDADRQALGESTIYRAAHAFEQSDWRRM